MIVYYEETYGKYYEVDENDPDKARAKLTYLIGEGKENSPEECQGSRVIPLSDNEDSWQYEIMDDVVDDMSEHEKMFYMMRLCNWYKEKLEKDKPDNVDTKENLAVSIMISNLISAMKQAEELLCMEVF